MYASVAEPQGVAVTDVTKGRTSGADFDPNRSVVPDRANGSRSRIACNLPIKEQRAVNTHAEALA